MLSFSKDNNISAIINPDIFGTASTFGYYTQTPIYDKKIPKLIDSKFMAAVKRLIGIKPKWCIRSKYIYKTTNVYGIEISDKQRNVIRRITFKTEQECNTAMKRIEEIMHEHIVQRTGYKPKRQKIIKSK